MTYVDPCYSNDTEAENYVTSLEDQQQDNYIDTQQINILPKPQPRTVSPALNNNNDYLHWNTKFQRIVDQDRQDQEKYLLDFHELSQEFTETASRIAVEIISSLIVEEDTERRNISDLQKSVIRKIGIRNDAIYKPDTSKGGVAGGIKFVENGIFFKLAVDSVGLYGGNEFSMKAATHELRSMKHVMKCQVPDLHVPVMTIIDWGGFRVLAQSFLPISPFTLKYGSDNGGKTVVNFSPTIESLVKQFAQKLNLKEHIVEWVNFDGIPQKTPISGPADLEIHEGFDDRNYVVDCARLFPPEPRFYILNVVFIPHEDFSSLKNIEVNFSQWDKAVCGLLGVKHPSQLKRLWIQESELIYADCGNVDHEMINRRASYLAEHSVESSERISALSPLIFGDAIFIHGGKGGSFLYNLLRPELVAIGQPLSSDAFSRFGRNDFEKHNAEVQEAFSHLVTEVIPTLSKELNDKSQLLLFQNHSPSVAKLFHKHGIPLRMMENVRCQITNSVVQSLLLTEMVTRVLKNLFRSELRCLRLRDQYSLASCAIAFFNKVLGESTAASQYWSVTVYCHMLRKYGLEQQITSSGNSAHLQNVIHRPSLFSSLQHATGFRFRQEINDNAQQHPEIFSEENPFALFHLEGWDNATVHSENREEVQKVLIRIQQPNVKTLLDSDAIYQIFEQKIQQTFPHSCYVENAQDVNQLVKGYTQLKEKVNKIKLDSSVDLVKVYTVRTAFLLLKSQQYENALSLVQDLLPAQNDNNSPNFGSTINLEILIGSFFIAASAHHGLHQFHEAVTNFKMAILLLEKLHGSIRYNGFSHPFGLLLFNGLVESLLQLHSTKVSDEIFRHSQFFLAVIGFFPFTSRLKRSHAKFLFGNEGIPSCLQWLQSQEVIQNSEVRNYFPDTSTNTISEFDSELQKLLLFWNPLNFTGISTSPESLLSDSPILPPSNKPSPPQEKTISLHWGINFHGECLVSSKIFQVSSQFDFVDMPTSSETVFGGNVNVKDAQTGGVFSAILFENGELWGIGIVPPDARAAGISSIQQHIDNKKASKIWTKYETLFVLCEDGTLYELSQQKKKIIKIPNTPEYSEIVTIVSGFRHHVILFASGKVLGIGSNNHHELRAKAEFVEEPVEIDPPPGERVIQAAVTRGATAFLCDSGAVYVWGAFSRVLGIGEIGDSDLYEKDYVPDPDWTQWNKVKFPENVKIKEISFGIYHALALSHDGKVYAWGKNNQGQLGIGSRTSQSFPRLISFLNDEHITSICAGFDLSYAITKSGKVYGWGEAVYGQLATLSQKFSSTPRLITAFPVSCKILKVHIGRQKVAAVAKIASLEAPASQENAKVVLKKSPDDYEPEIINSVSSSNNNNSSSTEVPIKIFHWGYLEHAFKCTWKDPVVLKELNPSIFDEVAVSDVAMGKCHMIALNSQGKVFSFGQGTQGALGLGHISMVTRQLAPIRFLTDKVVTAISCGSHHSVALTNSGQIYSWGGGMPVENIDDIPYLEEYNVGQLGHGDSFMRTVPMLIKSLSGVRITGISCGDWHTAAVSESGDVFTWGENTNGRLGLPIDIRFNMSPKKLGNDKIGRIDQVACGKDFTCVLNRQGQVYTFGSGNCGQLGNGSSQDSWEPVQVTGLDEVRVTKIACGRSHVIALATSSVSPLSLKDLTSRYTMRNLSYFRKTLRSIPADVVPLLEQQLERQLTQQYQHHLYGWGLAERGQIGSGEFSGASTLRKQLGFFKMRQQYPSGFFLTTPQKVLTEQFPPNFQVRDIQCGYYHTMCLLDDGTVFSWGEGTAGQTGLGHLESTDTPQPVALPEGRWLVKKIAAKFLVSQVVAADYTKFTLLPNIPQESSQSGEALSTGNSNSQTEPEVVCYSV